MNQTKGQTKTGKVVSVAMQHTIVVSVERTFSHPLYRKTVRKDRHFVAHNTLDGIVVGDTVKIVEIKPMSKTKHFMVVEKVERGK